MRVIAYVRVSRVAGRAGEGFISPAVQLAQIEQWAAANGHKIADRLEDLDQSGGKLNRPAFQQAIVLVEAGAADCIAVAKLDRFARSLSDAVRSIERIEAAGGDLVSIADRLDTTPSGRFARTMLLAIAELERDRFRESWSTAVEHASDRGLYIARTPPGYARADGRLVPSPYAAVVLCAFEMRASGRSWSEVSRMLSAANPSATPWSIHRTRHLIGNRAYLGEIWRAGRLLNADAHEPLVPRALYDQANATRRSVKTSRGGYLLAGLMRCEGCGFSMAGNTRLLAGGRRSVRYHCQEGRTGRCQAPASVEGSTAEPYVVSAFLERHAAAAAEQVPRDLSSLVAAADAAEAEMVAYRDDLDYARVLGREAHLAGLAARMDAYEAARDALGHVTPAAYESVDLAAYWPGATLDERRELLAAGVAAVVVTRAGGRGARARDRMRIDWS